MDNKERFDQIESLLADLARKQDQQSGQISQIITELNRQGEAISRQGEAINRQGEAINLQGEAINRQEQRLDDIGEQIGDVINILKISDARHAESEKRQDATLAEIREQGRRTDVTVEALRAMVRKMEDTSSRVDAVSGSQRQLIQLTQLNTDVLENQEPRIQRLEDEVFRQTS